MISDTMGIYFDIPYPHGYKSTFCTDKFASIFWGRHIHVFEFSTLSFYHQNSVISCCQMVCSSVVLAGA